MSPYIGVTGFMTPEEITAALAVVPPREQKSHLKIGLTKRRNHELMIGILASWKSLRGIALKPEWQKRYPKNIREIKNLFVSARKTTHRFEPLNLVHYACGENTIDMESDLRFIKRRLGKCFDGFQLNIPWPDPNILKNVIEPHSFDADGLGDWGDIVILQIGQKALAIADNDPKKIAARLEKYEDIVTGILIDPSGGQGKPFDPVETQKFLRLISNIPFLGVAGGLCADTLNLVKPLLNQGIDSISIDAEGKLRDKNGDMDIPAMQKYLAEAFEMFSEQS